MGNHYKDVNSGPRSSLQTGRIVTYHIQVKLTVTDLHMFTLYLLKATEVYKDGR